MHMCLTNRTAHPDPNDLVMMHAHEQTDREKGRERKTDRLEAASAAALGLMRDRKFHQPLSLLNGWRRRGHSRVSPSQAVQEAEGELLQADDA